MLKRERFVVKSASLAIALGVDRVEQATTARFVAAKLSVSATWVGQLVDCLGGSVGQFSRRQSDSQTDCRGGHTGGPTGIDQRESFAIGRFFAG